MCLSIHLFLFDEGSPLFAYRLKKMNKNEKYHPTTLKLEMDPSKYKDGKYIRHEWDNSSSANCNKISSAASSASLFEMSL